ncbi:hypothetical protein CNEO2_160037 [Clostridium neonatale]|nr:hypothetical protein CNEO2_130104 [Clostridium neonatale]CAI3197056.1 hypothetical protein CNEO2_160037 [Clostridium neonatale]
MYNIRKDCQYYGYIQYLKGENMNRFYDLLISILINALITLMICTVFMCKILQIK